MNYDKGSITAFLDQAAPFNDSYSKSLLANPIIRKMAEDIEVLYKDCDQYKAIIKAAGKTIRRQRSLMAIASVMCITAAAIQYERNQNAKTEKNGN
jgi:tRNA(His) 5'-end guanylyltransferase